MTPDTELFESACLEAELEDWLQRNRAPDLERAILASQRAEHASPSRGRWVAAILLLGAAVVPAVYWLRTAEETRHPNPLQDPEPGDAALQWVEPADEEELMRWLQRVEGLAARVDRVWGEPLQAPGEDEVGFVPLLGGGARTDVGWMRSDLEPVPAWTELAAGLDGQAALVAGPRGATRRIECRAALPDGRGLMFWVELPAGTRYATAEDVMVDGRRGRGVRFRAGSVSVAADREGTRRAWETVDELVSATLCLDRGLIHEHAIGVSLGRTRSASALEAGRRAPRLRPVGIDATELQALAEGGAARVLDLRWCTKIKDGALREVLPSFAHLHTLILHGRLGSDPFGDGPYPSVRTLILASTREDPWGPLRAPEARSLGHGSSSGPMFRAFPNLEVLRLNNGRVGDADLMALPGSIRELCLAFRFHDGGRGAGSEGLVAVARLPALRRLELPNLRNGQNPRVTDPGLEVLEALAGAAKLEILDLEGWFDRAGRGARPVAGDDGERRRRALAKLATLPKLRYLSLRNNPELEAADVEALREAPQIELLDLSGCAQLDQPDVFDEWSVDRLPQQDPASGAMPMLTDAEAASLLPGTATVLVVVRADGVVGAAAVLDCSHPRLGQAFREALMASRWTPATKGGVAVAARRSVSMTMGRRR